jgi:hypothetical protein
MHFIQTMHKNRLQTRKILQHVILLIPTVGCRYAHPHTIRMQLFCSSRNSSASIATNTYASCLELGTAMANALATRITETPSLHLTRNPSKSFCVI